MLTVGDEVTDVINFSDDALLITFDNFTPVWSVGTIDSTKSASFETSLSNDFITYIQNNYKANLDSLNLSFVTSNFSGVSNINARADRYPNIYKFEFWKREAAFSNDTVVDFGFYDVNLSVPFSSSYPSNYHTAYCTAHHNAIKKTISNYSGSIFDVTCTYSDSYSTYSATKSVAKGTCTYSALMVSSVSVSPESLVF